MKKKIERRIRHAKKRIQGYKERYGNSDDELQKHLSFHGARGLGYWEGRLSALEDILDELEGDSQ